MPGTSVRIVSPDGCELPVGQAGEIVVAGPSNCAGDYRNPAATADLEWRDGYIRTGDLGKLDAQGRLYFVARQKDLIKIACWSLYPQEVESVVDELSGIRFSAAIGIDRGGIEGEQLYVFAEVRESMTQPILRGTAIDIVRAVHDVLGVRPRNTVLLRPRRMPVTSNGKLQRSRLRDAFTSGYLVPGEDILFPLPVTH